MFSSSDYGARLILTHLFASSLNSKLQSCFVSYYTTPPDKHGHVVLVPCKNDASIHYCTVAYTGQSRFYKVTETNGPV